MNKLVLLVSGVFLLGVGGLVYNWQQGQKPTSGAGKPEAPLVDIVVPENLSMRALQGRTNFENYCVQCHGKNAAGKADYGPPLVHKIYEPAHHGDSAFFRAVQKGVPAHHWNFGDMKPVQGISESEISSILNYVRELQRANGIN